MEIVQAYKVWGVFASYDAYAPDTHDIFLIATEKLADAVCKYLNAHKEKTNVLAWVDGYESRKTFEHHPALTESLAKVITSLEQVIERLNEEV